MDNKSIKWSLSIIVQICANNRHFLVCLEFAINRRSLPGNYRPYLVCSAIWSRNAMLSAVHAVVVYLSVRLSVYVCVCLSHSGIV